MANKQIEVPVRVEVTVSEEAKEMLEILISSMENHAKIIEELIIAFKETESSLLAITIKGSN